MALRSRSSLPLTQLAREDLSEAGQLISAASAAVEVEVPSVARKSPVADVGDLPVEPRFEVNDEIHTTSIWAVDLAPAEDHLTTVPTTTDLPGREASGTKTGSRMSVTRISATRSGPSRPEARPGPPSPDLNGMRDHGMTVGCYPVAPRVSGGTPLTRRALW